MILPVGKIIVASLMVRGNQIFLTEKFDRQVINLFYRVLIQSFEFMEYVSVIGETDFC